MVLGPEQRDRYEVIEEVGRGGMAIVYRGHDRSLHREVAIKVLHSHLANSAESRARFQQEAHAVAKLRNRNIIEIYDYATTTDGDCSFIVTEYIDGATLRAFFDQQQVFFPEVAAMIGMEICFAIEHAHGQKIIHRDLKPENIMITHLGQLKLMDFGIAKLIDQKQQMTMTGSILGSPSHMAPEMLEGKELDYRSDLFSIGTILYWLATGQLPFVGKNPHQVLRRILEGVYPDPQQLNPQVGSDLSRVIKRCLAKDPDKRFESARQLEEALRLTLVAIDADECQHELQTFFKTPQEYVDKLSPKVIRALLRQGKAYLKTKQPLLAMEAFDRLLALEPDNTEALSLVSGLARTKRLGRRMMLGACVLGVAGLVLLAGWAKLHFWSSQQNDPEPNDPPKPSQQAPKPAEHGVSVMSATPTSLDEVSGTKSDTPQPENTGPIATATSKPKATALVQKEKSADQANLKSSAQARAPKKRLRRDITIRVNPYFDKLYIDDKLVAVMDQSNSYGMAYRTQLAVGTYRIRIQNKMCFDLEDKLTIQKKPSSKQADQPGFRLEYKPASLRIASELENTSVWIDGKYSGIADDKRVEIPISGQSYDRSKGYPVRLKLVHPVAGEVHKTVYVRPNQQIVYKAQRTDFQPKQNGDNQ